MMTKDVVDCLNSALEPAGEATLSPSKIGKLLHEFGSSSNFDKKHVRVHGGKTYMYNGIRRKVEDASKRPRLSSTAQQMSDVDDELRLERQLRQDLSLQLQYERQSRQELELQLEHERKVRHDLENQIQRIPWDRVRTELDAELESIRRSGGVLSIGPIKEDDPATLTEFSFFQLYEKLLKHAPNITSLLSAIGSSTDVTQTVKHQRTYTVWQLSLFLPRKIVTKSRDSNFC